LTNSRLNPPELHAYSKRIDEYRVSFFSWWRASMRRTVPDLDRITSDWVAAPLAS
jgi:hypothetical protein